MNEKALRAYMIAKIMLIPKGYHYLVTRPAKLQGMNSANYLQTICVANPPSKWVDLLISKMYLPEDVSANRMAVKALNMRLDTLRMTWDSRLQDSETRRTSA